MDLFMQWIGVCVATYVRLAVFWIRFSVYMSYFEFCCTAISPSPSFQRSCALQHAACVKQATSQWPAPRYVGLFGISHTQAARSPRLATLAPYRYSRDQLFAINNTTTRARLDSDLIRHLKKLSIGVNLPRKRSCRGGRRKQRKIEVVCGVGPPSDSLACPSTESGHVPPSILCNLTPMPPRPQGSNLTNLITVPLQDSATLPNQLCLCVFNARSVGTSSKRSAICDFVRDHDVDVLLLTETWLR